MCYPKFAWLETESPTTMEQYKAYNQQQWSYFHELCSIVHAGNHGAHYIYLLGEPYEGPYWSSIKALLEKPKVYDPEASVSGTRGQGPLTLRLNPQPRIQTASGNMSRTY